MWRVEYSTRWEMRNTVPAPPEAYYHHGIPKLDQSEAAHAVASLLSKPDVVKVRIVRT